MGEGDRKREHYADDRSTEDAGSEISGSNDCIGEGGVSSRSEGDALRTPEPLCRPVEDPRRNVRDTRGDTRNTTRSRSAICETADNGGGGEKRDRTWECEDQDVEKLFQFLVFGKLFNSVVFAYVVSTSLWQGII